jgi:hypothetical protein
MAAPDHEGATLVTIGKRRLLSLLGTAMASIAALMLFAATPASADSSCRPYDQIGATLCFEINSVYTYDVWVGIDVPMSQSAAQAIIDACAEPATATMIGEDQWYNDTLFTIPAYTVFAWSGGLSAGFSKTVQGSALDEDEDYSWFRDEDEVFVVIRLCDGRSYQSFTIHRYF